MPRGSSGKPKLASSAASRKSQRSASANPPASAGPLTAAITGFGQLATARKLPMLVSTSRSLCARSPPNSLVSIPEQKAGGAPVSTIAPTSGSSPSEPNDSASSTRRSVESAFRFSGRCSVTTATSSRRSNERRPAIGPSSTTEGRVEVTHRVHDLQHGRAARVRPDHRERAERGRYLPGRGGHGAGLGDAHHRGGLGE